MKSVLKKIISFVVFASLLIAFMPALTAEEALADTHNKPSHWAEQEISEAINKGLVPEQLQSNYQDNIKRYQYVLLALEVFDITGKNVDIKESRPFTDVLNHKYEQEIVRAFNAGIVKGDGKGNFYPDDFITRQEIASLVVNLLMQISPGKDFTVKGTYQYSDGDDISDWARYYIDYCFENKILAGYGNNVIDPKGNATIEQSIALLYRLANNEGLLDGTESTYSPIKLEDIGIETKNSFIAEYGTETFNVLKDLTENGEAEIISFWEKSATIALEYNTISLSSGDYEKNVFALIHDINEEPGVSAYKELILKTFKGGEKGVQIFEKYFEKMKAKEDINIREDISDIEFFVIETMRDAENVSYLTGYIQIKQ